MAQQNERDIIRPITIMLEGPTSYHAWSQNMIVFLKGYKLWRYVISSIPKPVPKPQSKAIATSKTAITTNDYEECLEDWESIQSKILSWFINTLFPPFIIFFLIMRLLMLLGNFWPIAIIALMIQA